MKIDGGGLRNTLPGVTIVLFRNVHLFNINQKHNLDHSLFLIVLNLLEIKLLKTRVDGLPLLHFFHHPEMGEAQTSERGLFQPLQQGTQETAKPGPAGDDVVVRAEDRFPLDKPDRKAGK